MNLKDPRTWVVLTFSDFPLGLFQREGWKWTKYDQAIISRFNWKDLRLPCTEFHVRRVYTCLNCTSFKFLKCIKAYQSNTTIPLPNSQQVADFGANWTSIPLPKLQVCVHQPSTRGQALALDPGDAAVAAWNPPELPALAVFKAGSFHEMHRENIPKPPHLILMLTPTKRWKRWKKMEKFWGLGFFGKDMYNFSKNFNNAFQKNTKVSTQK